MADPPFSTFWYSGTP